MMTMEEIHARLRRDMAEEKAGADTYLEMAKCAEAHGEEDLALGLFMMAADEKSHYEFIKSYTDEYMEKQRA